MKIKVIVNCDIKPTENENKVISSIENIFIPDEIEIEELGDVRRIRAISNSIRSFKTFHSLLRKQQILDAARRYLIKGIKGNKVIFHVNKQAAFMKAISFCDFPERESPLGPITFKIYFEDERDMRDFIDWLTPKTIDGKPIKEIELKDP